MKIINEKGKLFGIINVVDLLVLVAAIAVVAGVGYKLFAKQIKEVASPQVSLTMTVRVRGATPFLVNEVQRNSQVGKVSKDTPAPAIGTQEVRAGRTFIVKTNDFETTGNIDSVDIADN